MRCIVRKKKNTLVSVKLERGATLVELALSIPLLIAGIFIFIWIGTVWNARSALTYALGNATRLAITRGNQDVVGGALISDIQSWVDGNSPSPGLERLLSSPSEVGTYQAFYNSSATNPVFGLNLDQMPAVYAYTLAYINETMRKSVGQGVRFPCDADAPPDVGEGCLSCTFLNPVQPKLNASDPLVTWSSGSPPVDRIMVECKYQPSILVLTPIVRLLSIVTGGSGSIPKIVITRRKFISAAST